MIDLHTHSIFSDGVLIPAELVRRYEAYGYKALAITDHADQSNIDFIIPRIINAAEILNRAQSVTVVPGIEITHVPPVLIPDMVKQARSLGARIVVLHGETVAEPVAPGTNLAGIESGVDILAHPGLLTPDEARLAAEKDVYLEISARAGHSLTNGYVAKLALSAGVKMVLDSDCHEPENIMSEDFARKVVTGAGLPDDSLSAFLSNSRRLLKRAGYTV
ncbi:MAG: histidinol phosphate phosphatase domain-containing protein [Desulfobacteraceae bacterium]